MKLFVAALLFSTSAWAGITDNQFSVKIEKEKISLTPKKGFHLNAEGPASAIVDNLESINKPFLKTEKLFVFKKGEKSKTAKLSFYICDDKKTVCEKHEENLELSSGISKKTSENNKSELKTEFNSIQEVKLKSDNGLPTLLVFSAPWCPACVRMMTETYHKPEVEAQLKKLNFVKLNSDLPENSELSEKFQIKAIPTLILLDKKGEESFRWLDFQAPKNFAKSLANELQKVDLTAANLESAKLGDPAAASALAHRAFNKLDYSEAFKWFSLTNSNEDQKYKLASEVNLSQERAEESEANVKDYLSTLQKAIVLTASKLDQLRWTLDFFEKKSETKNFGIELKAKGLALIKEVDYLLKNPKVAKRVFVESTYGDYTGFEKDELMWMKAKLARLLEDKKLEDEIKKLSVDEIKKKKLNTDRPGEMLMAISYLREAGDTKATEDLYEKLIKKYTSSYVYFEKYSRFELKNKSYDKALTLINEALKYPQGNHPQLGLLKSQILKELKKNEEALLTINETLKVSGIEHKRYSKVVKKLNELKDELSK